MSISKSFYNPRGWILLFFCVLLPANPCRAESRSGELRVLVMDPLAAPLSCDCVEGHGQRKYEIWAEQLEILLGQKISLIFNENVGLAQKQTGKQFDLIIGKSNLVQFDLAHLKLKYTPLAKLTDKRGATTLRGLIVVRADSSLEHVADLSGHRIALGPIEDSETHQAVIDLFKEKGLDGKVKTVTAGSIESAVFALTDREVEAAAISDFMPSLLEGCDKVAEGSLRIIAQTAPRRFIELYASDGMPRQTKTELLNALAALKGDPVLNQVLETRWGFVPYDSPKKTWIDWRGKKHDGIYSLLPRTIPEKTEAVWSAKLTGPAMAGIAVTEQFVVVADKDAELANDIIRCLDPQTGQTLWSYRYPAGQQIDFTNAPRAMPIVCDGLVYTQGALGDLYCFDIATGKVIWKKNLITDFAGELPWWGYSSPPVVDGDQLIIAPGGKETSLVSVDRLTGRTIWKTPGHAAAYSTMQIIKFDNHREIIGYDVAGLAGWNPESGKRLWELIPRGSSDFNVTTPLIHHDLVVLATENNATRLYRLKDLVHRRGKPVAINEDCAPDTCSPVIWKERLFCTAYGELFCLDMKNNLEVLWSESGNEFYDHVHLVAGNDRVLLWTTSGDLILIDATADNYRPIVKLRPFGKSKQGEAKVESMSHPALTPDRIYLRDAHEIKCLAW